jgi:hypothetical protein
MKIQAMTLRACSFLAFYSVCIAFGAAFGQTPVSKPADTPAVLNRDQASTFLPPSVFFRGQSATIQARNSAGVRLEGGKLVLAAMVDTSGYSSAIQQTYQAYLITEVQLSISGQTLSPGAYGFGFVSGTMVVMDLGGNEILRTATTRDTAIARPTPLQILSSNGSVRLYLGRDYVALAFATR